MPCGIDEISRLDRPKKQNRYRLDYWTWSPVDALKINVPWLRIRQWMGIPFGDRHSCTRQAELSVLKSGQDGLIGSILRVVRTHHAVCMPDGSDTVVMQERVQTTGDTIRIDSNNKPGQNVREAGEDIPVGEVVLSEGKHIGPAEMGLLASTGIGEVNVYKLPRVAFFSTGDELRPVGSRLEKGQIYDSNRYTLYGMLSRLGIEINDLGVVGMRNRQLSRHFSDAVSQADVVITSEACPWRGRLCEGNTGTDRRGTLLESGHETGTAPGVREDWRCVVFWAAGQPGLCHGHVLYVCVTRP